MAVITVCRDSLVSPTRRIFELRLETTSARLPHRGDRATRIGGSGGRYAPESTELDFVMPLAA